MVIDIDRWYTKTAQSYFYHKDRLLVDGGEVMIPQKLGIKPGWPMDSEIREFEKYAEIWDYPSGN